MEKINNFLKALRRDSNTHSLYLEEWYLY